MINEESRFYPMKILTFTSRIVALALIVVGLFITVHVSQAQEPKFTPTLLVRGEIVKNSFTQDVNAHLYAFNGRANDVVTISMIQAENSTLDPYVVLLGGDGAVIASDDDSGPRLFSALIQNAQLPTDGTYFVLATTKTGERFNFEGIYGDLRSIPTDLSYEITLSGTWVADEELNYVSSPLANNRPIIATISQQTPVVYAYFTGRAGDVVTITTTRQNSDMDTILYLFDANGNRIAVNDDGENMGYFSQINRFQLPENGFYLVIATSYSFDVSYQLQSRDNWEGAGTFGLTIQ